MTGKHAATSLDGVTVRTASPDDAELLTRLKILWSGVDVVPDAETERRFADDLRQWMTRLGDSVVCGLAHDGSEAIGMAWMVVFERVPDLAGRRRLTGDVQSVYVTPGHRGHGIGRALVRLLVDEADARGIPRVTVSANESAAALYRGLGFTASPVLLERPRP